LTLQPRYFYQIYRFKSWFSHFHALFSLSLHVFMSLYLHIFISSYLDSSFLAHFHCIILKSWSSLYRTCNLAFHTIKNIYFNKFFVFHTFEIPLSSLFSRLTS
jgi:hypothetical protein